MTATTVAPVLGAAAVAATRGTRAGNGTGFDAVLRRQMDEPSAPGPADESPEARATGQRRDRPAGAPDRVGQDGAPRPDRDDGGHDQTPVTTRAGGSGGRRHGAGDGAVDGSGAGPGDGAAAGVAVDPSGAAGTAPAAVPAPALVPAGAATTSAAPAAGAAAADFAVGGLSAVPGSAAPAVSGSVSPAVPAPVSSAASAPAGPGVGTVAVVPAGPPATAPGSPADPPVGAGPGTGSTAGAAASGGGSAADAGLGAAAAGADAAAWRSGAGLRNPAVRSPQLDPATATMSTGAAGTSVHHDPRRAGPATGPATGSMTAATAAPPAVPGEQAAQPAPPSGAAAQPAAASAAPSVPVAEQLGARLRSLSGLATGRHVLSVPLDPEHLGSVRVVAHIGPDAVRVELVGATDAAREALRGALTDLRRDLASAGLTVEVGVGGGQHPGPGAEHPGSGASPGFASTDGSSSDARSPGARTHSGRPDPPAVRTGGPTTARPPLRAAPVRGLDVLV